MLRESRWTRVFALAVAAAAWASACNDATAPPAPRRLEVAAGNLQSARVGETLPESLAVRLVDTHGAPVRGATVRFLVLSGGGAVSPASVSTDGAGTAKTAWTLGAGSGPGTVRAVVDGAPPVDFAATSSTWITLEVRQPAAGLEVRDTLEVEVAASHPWSVVTRVKAWVEGRQAMLDSVAGTSRRGTLLVDEIGNGARVLRVRAYSYEGDSADTEVPFVVRRLRPSIRVDSPLQGDVTPASVRIDAVCTDTIGRPCARLVVESGGKVVAEGPGTVHTTYAPGPGQPPAFRLVFEGEDAAGARSWTWFRDVTVAGSPRWTEVASPGVRVLDFDGVRLLFEERSSLPPTVRIRDLSPGGEETPLAPVDAFPGFFTEGYLFAGGVVGRSNEGQLFDWRSGVMRSISDGARVEFVVYRGEWVAWRDPGWGRGHRFHLPTGSHRLVELAGWVPELLLGPNGDMAWGEGTISVLHGDRLLRVERPSYVTMGGVWGRSTVWCTHSRGVARATDGVHLLVQQYIQCAAPRSPVWVNDPAQVLLVDRLDSAVVLPAIPARVALNGGWIAMSWPGHIGVVPPGSIGERSAWTEVAIDSVADMESLSPTGALVYDWPGVPRRPPPCDPFLCTVPSPVGTRYLLRPGGVPVDIGRKVGRVVWVGDRVYLLVGRKLFRVDA